MQGKARVDRYSLYRRPRKTEPAHLQPKLVKGTEAIVKELRGMILASREYMACTPAPGMHTAYNYLLGQIQSVLALAREGRHGGIRWLTDIDQGNGVVVRKLVALGMEVRHVEEPPLSFSMTDRLACISTRTSEESVEDARVLITDDALQLRRHREKFEDLWRKAVSARIRLSELGDGRQGKTEIYRGEGNLFKLLSQLIANEDERIDVSVGVGGATSIVDSEPSMDLLAGAKARGLRLRILTEVSRADIGHCMGLAKFAKVRHVEGVSGSFAVTSREWLAGTSPADSGTDPQVIYSSVGQLVEQYRYVFEALWRRAIPLNARVQEIEKGKEVTTVEVLHDRREANEKAWEMVDGAERSVQLLFSTPESVVTQHDRGALKVLEGPIRRGASIRVLVPEDERTSSLVELYSAKFPSLEAKLIDRSMKTRLSVLVVDQARTMLFEESEGAEAKETPSATLLVNSKQIARSYGAIFDNLWRQAELNENLKRLGKAQKEFVDVAAHEFRSPVQAILGYAELAKEGSSEDFREYSNKILTRALRLQSLSEDLLSVASIESGALKLNLEETDLASCVEACQEEFKERAKGRGVEISFKNEAGSTTVRGDKRRLTQVLSNLLDNAIKFSEGSPVAVTVGERVKDGRKELVTTVVDEGSGVDPEVLPRLFTKFASKSSQGTGLGLYISKSIVDAHGGTIWHDQNPKGRGSVFGFALPMK